MSLRTKRGLIQMAYHGAVGLVCLIGIAAGEALGNPDLSILWAIVAVAHGLTFNFNPIPRFIQQELIRSAECPACGEIIDLIQTWDCSCAYVSWEPRHAFAPCPECRRTFRWLVCPNCEASINI